MMTAKCLLDADDRPVFVRGYAAPYNSLSCPLDSLDGKRELIKPRAFDYALQHLRMSLTCTLHHLGAPGVIGSIFDGTLKIWSDSYGLAFECGPFAVDMRNAGALASIVRGTIRGCSWRGVPAEVATELIGGEQVVVIKKIQYLAHISPGSANAAAYPGAATWCSHEHLDDLPDHMKPLARRWREHRPAAKPSLVTRAEAPGPQAPSRAEQAAKAHHDAKARRLTKVAP